MSSEDCDTDFVKAAAVFLNGSGIQGRHARGGAITDDNVLLLFNASESDVEFTVPGPTYAENWRVAIDTAQFDTAQLEHAEPIGADTTVTAISRSVLVLVAADPR